MNRKNVEVEFLVFSFLVWFINFGGCSTSQVAPPAPPTPPAYTEVPHPSGMDLGDLQFIFTDPKAPKAEILKDCDGDFNRLKTLTSSKEEQAEGVVELVKSDPVKYHWCFYGKILTVEEELRKDSYVDQKQKLVLENFAFLVPVARAFLLAFHDTRYLRWATLKYRRLSEWVFYRKLELSPEGTMELVEASNPFGLWRDTSGKQPILEKYHLNPMPGEVGRVPQAQASVSPAPSAQPSSAPVPTADGPLVPVPADQMPASNEAPQAPASGAQAPTANEPQAPRN
jgi:hypothetical protein